MLVSFNFLNFLNRAQQELDYLNGESSSPVFVEELQALRHHKSDLEEKLFCLQDSRRHLMGQMETLMKLLKVCLAVQRICKGIN